MRVFNGLDELRAAVGEHLGHSDWVPITQEQVNAFAEATGDHQWIHVDPERAAKESPFGGPVAHGYLTLSLVPVLLAQIVEITGFRMAVNYGTEKVRFPAPVPVGSRIRLHVAVGDVVDIPAGKQMTFHHTIELEDSEKPACVAETVVLLLP